MSRVQKSRALVRALPSELKVSKSDGSYLTDVKGKTYIDFVMGWCVGNLGWQNPELTKNVAKYRGPDYIYPGYAYGPWFELARLLTSLAPGKLTKCFRATGGSEAVDMALQAAMLHTGKISTRGCSVPGPFAHSQHRERFARVRRSRQEKAGLTFDVWPRRPGAL